MLALSKPSQTITVPFCTNPISLTPAPATPPSSLPFLLSSTSYVRQFIMLDIGLNLIILESRIHRIDVITDKTTPPHPRSRDQEVVKIRPGRSSSIDLPPGGTTTPSAAPSGSVSVRGFCCIRLKWIIVRVNKAKDAVTYCCNYVTILFFFEK